MGADKHNSPLTPDAQKKSLAQQQPQEPKRIQEADPARRQAGDKPAVEQVSAEKPDHRA